MINNTSIIRQQK